MMSKLFIVLLTWLGFNFNQSKYDLHKRSTWDDHKRNLNIWVLNNYGIVALATIIFLLIIFTIVCFLIVGTSATEDTIYSLNKVI